MELARSKNIAPLPLIKSHCGLRLPPERHCLLSANYKVRAAEAQPKKLTKSALDRSSAKSKPNGSTSLKRQSMSNPSKTQNVQIPKPVIKFSGNSNTKSNGTAQTPKAAPQPTVSIASSQSKLSTEIKMEIEDDYNSNDSKSLKRKREDDDDDEFEVVG